MNKRKERTTRIINELLLESAIGIHELATTLGVSEMTVRRDLKYLEKENIIRLVHGVAVLNPSSRPGERKRRYLITEEETVRTEEKKRIGRKAAELLEPNDIIIVDSGSTTNYFTSAIPVDLPLTILCFALNILIEAHRKPKCKLVFAGGYLHEDTLMFESPESIALIKKFRATKAFISASGIDLTLGVTCANSYEIEAKEASIQSAKKRILLADSSKFGKIRSAYFADLKDFDIIITDSEIPEEYVEPIKALGIELIIG